MAAVVDLPFEPVTPMIRAGQFSMNNSSSVQSRAPALAGDLQPRAVRPHGRIDHHEIGAAKIFFAVAAEVHCGDRHVGQQRQRIGQARLRRPDR